ncbi:hypothetical protein ACIQZB_32700 [Streptomyces sp. NPDC097727]|uniref:hypothetical protein n=1 Tax=Streptomyces sp. NPDC097727 TaxID=3366092 RepID=UPI00382CEBC8
MLRLWESGRSGGFLLYDVDWSRTNLLAGAITATVVTPDGREIRVPWRADVLWPLMSLLVFHGVLNPAPVLDLRRRRARPATGAVMDLPADGGLTAAGPRV